MSNKIFKPNFNKWLPSKHSLLNNNIIQFKFQEFTVFSVRKSLFCVVFSVRSQQYLLFSMILFLLRKVFSVTILGSFSENSTNLVKSTFTRELLNSLWEIDRFCIISYFCIAFSFSQHFLSLLPRNVILSCTDEK